MNAAPDIAAARPAFRREAVTWYCYLLLGVMTYFVSIQGNIIPFLKQELSLTYWQVSLHASALAIGTLGAGLFGDRIASFVGRRRTLAVAALGASTGAVLLALSPAVWATLASCLVIGAFGGLIAAIQPAVLSDVHRQGRNIAFAEGNAICYAFAIVAPLLTGLAVRSGWSWRVVPLAGAVAGVAIVLAYARTPVPAGRPPKTSSAGRLPPAYWAFWAMLGFSVALEFSALLWAPAYLDHVVGLSESGAATGATAFFAGMLIGRTVGVGLMRRYSLPTLLAGTAIVTLVGFVAWWSALSAAVAIAGLFVIGLGIAQFFPLSLSFAMGAAGEAADRGSARVMLAPGLAILLNPPLLGWIADLAGLHLAQLTIPVFTLLAVAAYFAGQRLSRSPTSVASAL